MTEYNLKYGEGRMHLSIPEDQMLQTIKGNEIPAIEDLAGKVREALANPTGAAPLKERVSSTDKVCILVSDITRAWISYPAFLPTVLDVLNEGGVPDENIYLLTALGTHRAHVGGELKALLGEDVLRRVQVFEHDCHDKEKLKYLGVTSRGTEVWVNRKALEVDKLILTGGIVYHLFAGFGGGRKSIMPGIGGWDTVQMNHNFTLASIEEGGLNPLAGAGSLEENPVNRDMLEITEMVHPDFLINVIPAPEGGICGIVAGDPVEAWLEGCAHVTSIYGIPIQEKGEFVIASAGGFPKDINFYQTVKTIYNANHAVADGGVVIVLSECRDITEPPEFSNWLVYDDPESMEKALRTNFTVPGYAAYYSVRAARHAHFIVVTLPSEENFTLIKKVGMTPVASLEEGIQLASDWLGKRPKTILMPQAANTFPILSGQKTSANR